jgi:signal transduction histidine kinase/ActR/RegA family two-component response regulator
MRGWAVYDSTTKTPVLWFHTPVDANFAATGRVGISPVFIAELDCPDVRRMRFCVKNTPLRTKILLALLAISACLTCGTLLIVRYTVQKKMRESIREDLRSSVRTFQTFEQQREESLTRSAALLASLPTVRALMTTQDGATIQDEAEGLLKESGADLLLLSDRTGRLFASQSRKAGLTTDVLQKLLVATVEKSEDRDWWLADGHLFEVSVQPIEFGQGPQQTTIGILVVGHEINQQSAKAFGAIAGSDVVFQAADTLIASGLSAEELKNFAGYLRTNGDGQAEDISEIQLGKERYLATTEKLSQGSGLSVSLNVLKSFDRATSFLQSLNQILIGLGIVALVAGAIFGFLISNGITQPLEKLVSGVQALERGDYSYPLTATSADEVGLVTNAFGRMRESLERGRKEQQELEQRLRQAHKMEAVGRLAGGVAHDFNNLLTIIRGHSDLLADRMEGNPQKKSVDQIQKAADRAVGMTRQLLAFSRMQVLQPRVLDLNAIIGEMGKMLPRLIGEHIEYSFVPEAQLAAVKADPGQIEQVLMNLAVNARDAMPDGGKLQVRTANIEMSPAEAALRPSMAAGSYALIRVSDTGHGMDEQTKAQIFEPFFTTKEVGKGTGLGLATVYGIVKQSGGFIWVDSAPGKGAAFEIYLPATTATGQSSNEVELQRTLPRGSETVLLVEDETGVRELASEFLRGAGYKVLEGHDGEDGLRVSERYSGGIDMLLTDMVMPRLSGKELASRVKEKRPGIKVVMMSGYSEFNSDTNGDKDSFAALAKPFSMRSLIEKVDEVLRGHAKAGTTKEPAIVKTES